MRYHIRFVYLGYYLTRLDWKKFRRFFRAVKKEKQWGGLRLFKDITGSVFRYNIAPMEYFYFRFYDLDPAERRKYAGTGFMYEYQLVMNPREFREPLVDKRVFHRVYKDFIHHDHADLPTFRKDTGKASRIMGNPSGKIVVKKHDGQCGIGVEVLPTEGLTIGQVARRMESMGNDLVESFITQHPDLMKLSPSGLNTVRIFTQLTADDRVEILGCRLRISVNSVVDNLAAGNMAAPIDEHTGILTGPGVYSDIEKKDAYEHPVTGVKIPGFRIPHWTEVLELVRQAALYYPQCRSVGWDIAVTEKGPELVEGNHDWCKLVWQLPVKEGLKEILERHLKEYNANQKTPVQS